MRANLFKLIKQNKYPEIRFVEKLRQGVSKLEEAENHIPSKTVKPSSVKCLRKCGFMLLGAEPDAHKIQQQLAYIMHMGSSIHQYTQQALVYMTRHEMGIKYLNVGDYVQSHPELELDIKSPANIEEGRFETHLFSKKYNCSFLVDGLIEFEGNNYILEIKSCASNYKMTTFNPAHKAQAVLYSLLLKIRSVMFLYIDRNFFNMKPFIFSPSAEELHDMDLGIQDTLALCAKGKLPSKPKEANREFCNYCEYKGACATND